ncbi:MAG: hypothetical protein ABSE57_30940 [Bryobacteraceae bacterium]
MERGDSPVGWTGDVELVVLYFVIRQHQLGFPLPVKAGAGMWVWEKLWKDCGFTHPR